MLNSIENALRRAGIETQRAQAGSPAPVEQVGLALAADAQGRQRQLWITPMPGLEDQLAEGIHLVQFFVELPIRLALDAEAELAGLILKLNNVIPLGAFGLHQSKGAVVYRYVLVAGPDLAGGGQAALETVLLLSYVLDQFSGTLESVATGQKTLAQAIVDLEGGAPDSGLN